MAPEMRRSRTPIFRPTKPRGRNRNTSGSTNGIEWHRTAFEKRRRRKKARTMEGMAETRPRNRHTSRASFACARCKKAKRRCDIAQQIGQGKACSACRQRSETCDSSQHGEDKRRRRERHNTAELRMRIASLENEIRAISAHSGSKGTEDRQPSQSTLQLVSTPEQQASQRVDSPARQLAHPSPAISKRIPSVTPESPLGFHATNAGNGSLASPKSSTCPPDDGLKATSQDLKWFPTGMDEVTPPSSILRGIQGKNQRYFGATTMFPYGERHSPPPRHTVADYLAEGTAFAYCPGRFLGA